MQRFTPTFLAAATSNVFINYFFMKNLMCPVNKTIVMNVVIVTTTMLNEAQ